MIERMNPIDEEAEADRLAYLASTRETFEDKGEETEERFGPGSFGMHELLDRLHVVQSGWHDHVLTHAACTLYPDLFLQAYKIADMISDLYQMVGCKDDPDSEWRDGGCWHKEPSDVRVDPGNTPGMERDAGSVHNEDVTLPP